MKSKNIQYIYRKGSFDSAHRVMNEYMKCYNVHGHTYLYELCFSFENMEDIGYAIDFKEIKRVGAQWIDDILDHGCLLNPKDGRLINTVQEYGTKLWLMSLAGKGKYCNPSVENIAREMFLAMEILFDTMYKDSPTGLKIHKITLYETPNCWTECTSESIPDSERENFRQVRFQEIYNYAQEKGIVEYDDRKTVSCGVN